MVKILIEPPKVEIQFTGDPLDIAANIMTAAHGIYNGLLMKDREKAEMFKFFMQGMTADGSPAWRGGLDMTMVTIPKKKSDTPTGQS